MKKGTELRPWIGQQYHANPKLKRRVEELVTEMEIEQGLVALREERGVPRTALGKIIGPPRSGAVSGSTSSGSRAGGGAPPAAAATRLAEGECPQPAPLRTSAPGV